jgi:hypothetical protein
MAGVAVGENGWFTVLFYHEITPLSSLPIL